MPSDSPGFEQQAATPIEGERRPAAEEVINRTAHDLMAPPAGHSTVLIAPYQCLDVAARPDQRRIQVQVA